MAVFLGPDTCRHCCSHTPNALLQKRAPLRRSDSCEKPGNGSLLSVSEGHSREVPEVQILIWGNVTYQDILTGGQTEKNQVQRKMFVVVTSVWGSLECGLIRKALD